jgi:Zn ribbon nucleic-acid-binding protein
MADDDKIVCPRCLGATTLLFDYPDMEIHQCVRCKFTTKVFKVAPEDVE